jgi:hypothetical protein
MPPLTDPEPLRHYREALSQWECSGYVTWQKLAADWVYGNMDRLTPRRVSQLMWEYVDGGGVIDEVPERRQEWSEHRFHYDLRLQIGDRRIYIETRLLMERDIADSTVNVVNIHDA